VAARWLKAASGFRRVAIAAALLVVALTAGGYWYTQRLPVADIATLTSGGASLAADEESYLRLRRLPGFADRAEQLWLEALDRRSGAAATLADAAAVDARLRALPGQDAPADRLLAEFWLRRARAAAHREQRDAALLMAQRAAALPAAEPHAAAYLAELVGSDYRYLERSLRLATAPGYWHMRFDDSALLVLDAERRVLRTPFDAAAGGGALEGELARLTALKPAALTRELMVSGEGTAGELELSLAVQHPEGGELLVTLRAPSGAEAAVRVPRGDGTAVESLVFQAARGSPLAQLADEGLEGSWRLTIVDRAEGNTGFLVGWGLMFGPVSAHEDFADGLAIPDPTRAEDVTVRTVGDRALVVPTTPGAIGAVALWDLATGRLEHDFTLPAPPRHVALDATGSHVLAATDRLLSLWSADGALVAEPGTQTEFVLPPVFSSDGAYFAIAERVEGAAPLVSVLRSSDASLVASSDGADSVEEWQLGPGARYFALRGPANVVRVLETRRGTELMRLQHAAAVQRIVHTQDGSTLVTVDAAGAIVAWTFANGAAMPRYIGRTPSAASVSVAAGRLAYACDDGAVSIVATATGAEIARVRQPHDTEVARTQLAADGTELVTQRGAMLRRWRLPNEVPPTAAVTASAAAPPVLALDRGADVVALGLRSGQLEVGPQSLLAKPGSTLAFFGHRGPITAAIIDATRGLAATGGADGIVRLWDSATGEPIGIVMQPAAAAIDFVAMSFDGGAVASAAGRIVRIADSGTGRVTEELTVDGAVAALRFAPGARVLAVADSSGAVTLAGGARRRIAQLGAAATALAFAPDGAQLVVGDAAGALRLVGVEDGELGAVAREWPGPIRWLEFSPDGRVLFVVTNEWLHALDATTSALEPLFSRVLPLLPTSSAVLPTSASSVRFVGFDSGGALAATSFDLAAAPAAPTDGAVLVARDWSAALGLTLGDDGEPELSYQ